MNKFSGIFVRFFRTLLYIINKKEVIMADEKLKILYLRDVLLAETDPDHVLTADRLGAIMEDRYGIRTQRKTIYTDIARLNDYGMDIRQKKGAEHGFYVAGRDFELPELKLLVDAVQAAKFIPTGKSEDLIGRLARLTSRHQARELRRQVFIFNRAKTGNETILRNVDLIHAAISGNKRISFKYSDWNVKKQLVLRHGGAWFLASPWSLTWDNANYYLVAFDHRSEHIRHYRVDKIQELVVVDAPREGRKLFEGFDLAAFSRKTFGMFSGYDAQVSFHCPDKLAGVMIDRFGRDIMIVPAEPGFFRTHVTVSVSRQFFGWVTGIGPDLRIDGPEPVKKEYLAYLDEIRSAYGPAREEA